MKIISSLIFKNQLIDKFTVFSSLRDSTIYWNVGLLAASYCQQDRISILILSGTPSLIFGLFYSSDISLISSYTLVPQNA